MPPEHHTPPNSRILLVSVGALSALVLIGVVVYALYTQQQAQDQIPVLETPEVVEVVPLSPPPEDSSESLGGTLYEKTQNPIQDKLPEQVPVANPINDAYKNPFE